MYDHCSKIIVLHLLQGLVFTLFLFSQERKPIILYDFLFILSYFIFFSFPHRHSGIEFHNSKFWQRVSRTQTFTVLGSISLVDLPSKYKSRHRSQTRTKNIPFYYSPQLSFTDRYLL